MHNADLIIARIDDLKLDTQEIKDHLRELNGRTAKMETQVFVHWTLWGLLGATLLAIIPAILVIFP